MAAIIPRWEWRTFGATLRAAEEAFAALTPGPVEESDELYLLSTTATTSRSATTWWTSRCSSRSTPTAWSGGSR